MPGPAFNKMNRNQLFNFAMRTLKPIADHLADCSPDVFRARLAVLEDLHAGWLTQSSSCVSTVEQPRASHQDTPGGSVDVETSVSDLKEQLPGTRRDDPVGPEGKMTAPVHLQDKAKGGVATDEYYCSVNTQAASSCSKPGTSQLRLPLVKPRGRPKCKSVQQSKRKRELSGVATTPFVQMTVTAQHKRK